MRAVIVFVLLLVSACTHVQIGATSNVSAASTTAAGLQVQGGGALTAVLVAATLVAGATTAGGMQPDRVIVEQDCTKPIEFSENLRCR
jgi:hypothetical protein